ncbi:MAG: GRRM system radical SAM/SPASM domain protein [Verrucomicrobiales bacterium]|nr:GRRM system radical SAM/SPASM domain protein [Verrucomicrobiales bacterium]
MKPSLSNAPKQELTDFEIDQPDELRPLSLGLLVIQPSPFCNINCDYCYLPDRTDTRRMEFAVLQKTLERVFSSGLVQHPFTILWHAGEPLAVPLRWYKEAFEMINTYPGAKENIQHSFQSNGTLLNDAWCEFIKGNQVEIGLSIDGPAHIHDYHRKTRKGEGTHAKAMKGLETLKRHGIPHGVVSVVSNEALDHADEIYDFYRENDINGVGLNIEEVEGVNRASSLEVQKGEEKIRNFLTRMYMRNKADGFPIHIREFETARENIVQPEINLHPDGSFANLEVEPFSMINVDCFGNFSSFSPELLGQATEKYTTFNFGSMLSNQIFDATQNPVFQRVLEDIESGNRKCAETCEFFQYCGGASPSNKYYENGTFDSAETMHCRSMIQIPMEIVLADFESDLGLNPEPL